MNKTEIKKDADYKSKNELIFTDPKLMENIMIALFFIFILAIIAFWNILPEHVFIFVIPFFSLSTIFLLRSKSKYHVDSALFIANILLIMTVFAIIACTATTVGMYITIG